MGPAQRVAEKGPAQRVAEKWASSFSKAVGNSNGSVWALKFGFHQGCWEFKRLSLRFEFQVSSRLLGIQVAQFGV